MGKFIKHTKEEHLESLKQLRTLRDTNVPFIDEKRKEIKKELTLLSKERTLLIWNVERKETYLEELGIPFEKEEKVYIKNK